MADYGVIKIGGKKTNYRCITIATLSDEIKKRNLFGHVKSKKDKFITSGPFFTQDMDHSLKRAKEIMSGYFQKYIDKDESFKKQWEIGSGEGGYVCTNSGVIALIRVLKSRGMIISDFPIS